VVRVLAEDQHLHTLVRGGVQGGEDLVARRVDRTVLPFLLDEFGELLEVGLARLVAEGLLPGLGQGGRHVVQLSYLRGAFGSRSAVRDSRPEGTPRH
jgi:hypothetical protein